MGTSMMGRLAVIFPDLDTGARISLVHPPIYLVYLRVRYYATAPTGYRNPRLQSEHHSPSYFYLYQDLQIIKVKHFIPYLTAEPS